MLEIKKLLIANRGEIALRIIRACKELGIETSVMHSTLDKGQLFVKKADNAFEVKSSDPTKCYLDLKKIISVAKRADVDAIHPGYGFLSELPEFPSECRRNGMVFVGPTEKNMMVMGDKLAAKKMAKKIRIPHIPGPPEPVEFGGEALTLAKEIGFPVVLKSVCGGGGKGIRVVRNSKQMEQALQSSRNESLVNFAKEEVLIEKFFDDSRHIEVQVLCTGRGKGVHLFERECSVQRKFQKIVEETPSPCIGDKTREKITKLALKLVDAIGYRNAGTVEFIKSGDEIFFMEMNTRLQVEHGITELVTGKDIVREQINIASGRGISFKQKEVSINGHAFEARVNAESPETFLPSIGMVEQTEIPFGPGIRVDSCLFDGMTVSPFYDSLVAKVMSLAGNREQARIRMLLALDDLEVKGIETNTPLLKEIFSNKAFIQGKLSTSFLGANKIVEEVKKKWHKKNLRERNRITAIIAVALVEMLNKKQKRTPSNWVLSNRI